MADNEHNTMHNVSLMFPRRLMCAFESHGECVTRFKQNTHSQAQHNDNTSSDNKQLLWPSVSGALACGTRSLRSQIVYVCDACVQFVDMCAMASMLCLGVVLNNAFVDFNCWCWR